MDQLVRLIDDFKNGGREWKDIFGTFSTFISVVDGRKKLNLLDPFNEDLSQYQNEIFSYYIKTGKWNLIKNRIISWLVDVKKEGKKYYLVLNHREDLASLFRDPDTIKAVLGDDNYDHDYDAISDVYDNVIGELDPKNLNELKKIVVEKLDGIEIDPSTRLLIEISEVQQTDYVMVDESNIEQIIGDSETMTEILDNELDDLNTNLKNIGNNAYSIAYESEVLDDVMKVVEGFFGNRGQWDNNDNYKIDVTGTLEEILKNYINEDGQTVEYFGSLMGVVEEFLYDKKLNVRIPDYPDHRLMKKYLNEIFMDYIHD